MENQEATASRDVVEGPSRQPDGQPVILGFRDWRCSEIRGEVDFHVKLRHSDGTVQKEWMTITRLDMKLWDEMQRFLYVKLTQVKGYAGVRLRFNVGGSGSGDQSRTAQQSDQVVDWRYSKTREELLFLVRRQREGSKSEEWTEVVPSDVQLWSTIKQWLRHQIAVEQQAVANVVNSTSKSAQHGGGGDKEEVASTLEPSHQRRPFPAATGSDRLTSGATVAAAETSGRPAEAPSQLPHSAGSGGHHSGTHPVATQTTGTHTHPARVTTAMGQLQGVGDGPPGHAAGAHRRQGAGAADAGAVSGAEASTGRLVAPPIWPPAVSTGHTDPITSPPHSDAAGVQEGATNPLKRMRVSSSGGPPHPGSAGQTDAVPADATMPGQEGGNN